MSQFTSAHTIAPIGRPVNGAAQLWRHISRLYLVRADQRTTYGSFEASISSRFLRDIPETLLQRTAPRRSARDTNSTWGGRGSRWRSDSSWDDGASRLAPPRRGSEEESQTPARRTVLLRGCEQHGRRDHSRQTQAQRNAHRPVLS